MSYNPDDCLNEIENNEIENNEIEMIDLYMNMKEYCENNSVFIMDECKGSDIINFILSHTT